MKKQMASSTIKDDGDVDNRIQTNDNNSVSTNAACDANPAWLSALLAAPPAATMTRQFRRFKHAESHLIVRQHLSTLLVVHLAPSHPALTSGSAVTSVRFHVVPSLRATSTHRKRSLHHDSAVTADDATASILVCTVSTSDNAQFDVRMNLFGEVRDVNPLLADNSLRLSAANCDSTAYLVLFLPTQRCHRDLLDGSTGWQSMSTEAVTTTTQSASSTVASAHETETASNVSIS
jgi:hypothetical protein